MTGQGPGIDSLDAHHVIFLKIGIQTHAGAPVGIAILVLPDNEAGQEKPPALDILGINTGITDLGIGHGNHLPFVGGIGQNLLIAGHGGIEDHLSG